MVAMRESNLDEICGSVFYLFWKSGKEPRRYLLQTTRIDAARTEFLWKDKCNRKSKKKIFKGQKLDGYQPFLQGLQWAVEEKKRIPYQKGFFLSWATNKLYAGLILFYFLIINYV